MTDAPSQKKPPAAQKAARELEAAAALHRSGQLDEAEAAYQSVLELDGANAAALQLLGVIAIQRNRLSVAIDFFDRALAIKPAYADAHNNRGVVLQNLKRHEEALASFDRALALEPSYADAHSNRGVALHELRRYEEALESLDRALAIMPGFAQAHSNRGNALKELKRLDEALASYDSALALNPSYAETHYNRGKVLQDMARRDEALVSYDRALGIRPGYADALNNRGNVLAELNRPLEALDSYERALGIHPGSAATHSNRGGLLTQMNRLTEALASLDHALAIGPNNAEAYNNRGNALMALRRLDEALTSYDQALRLKPDFANALRNRGVVLEELKRPEEALTSYSKAMAIDPDLEFLYGAWLFAALQVCDWSDFSRRVDDLAERIRHGRSATPPFPLVALTASAALQLQAARTWMTRKHPPMPRVDDLPKRLRGARIRVGYFSADFHEHATTYLMAELFERHDRNRFELFAFSYGPEANDAMRSRVRAAFDQFIDVSHLSDKDVADLSRNVGIDIAVDLKGYTRQSRPGIFACRAAPVQVAYLGYPGTTGADFMDYLIADHTLIPSASRPYYTEKIVYLPDSYQANDSQRAIAERTYTRQDIGLPAKGIVFCCFNANFKITPHTFEGWMRILHRVEGSVLWLLEDNPTAAKNLRAEAERKGVGAARLIFAKRLPLADHLARHRAADLFLDTMPCNAHTTASDALWAGLPVLTCAGESFASRVAASLLNAVGLAEMVTSTREEYEALAIALVREPGRLRALTLKLDRVRATAPLFSTERFTASLERAYLRMHERHRSGLPPEDIQVDG